MGVKSSVNKYNQAQKVDGQAQQVVGQDPTTNGTPLPCVGNLYTYRLEVEVLSWNHARDKDKQKPCRTILGRLHNTKEMREYTTNERAALLVVI